MMFAIGVGLLTVPIAEGRKLFFIRNTRDVEYFLGVPVLAAIPETLTPIERRRRWRNVFAARLALLLLVLAIPAAVLVLKHFNTIQTLLR